MSSVCRGLGFELFFCLVSSVCRGLGFSFFCLVSSVCRGLGFRLKVSRASELLGLQTLLSEAHLQEPCLGVRVGLMVLSIGSKVVLFVVSI